MFTRGRWNTSFEVYGHRAGSFQRAGLCSDHLSFSHLVNNVLTERTLWTRDTDIAGKCWHFLVQRKRNKNFVAGVNKRTKYMRRRRVSIYFWPRSVSGLDNKQCERKMHYLKRRRRLQAPPTLVSSCHTLYPICMYHLLYSLKSFLPLD